jgi:MOSC domain-containing protein
VSGWVEQVLVAPTADAPLQSLQHAAVLTGGGIEGDRYQLGLGTWSNYPDQRGKDLTLIEAEVLSTVRLSGAAARRNIVTQDVRLNDLVGNHFRIGEVVCRGVRLCEPCRQLEQRTGVTIPMLLHRGGLRADVIVGGTLHVGDRLELEPDSVATAI